MALEVLRLGANVFWMDTDVGIFHDPLPFLVGDADISISSDAHVLPYVSRKGGDVRKIALTGGIATGKTYVSNRLREAGVPVVDADLLSREVVTPGSPALAAIRKRFGPDAVRRDGTMDRIRVGQIVFKDKRARLDLEAIIHPAVVKAVNDFLAALPKRTPFAVADIPLLYETGRDHDFDRVIVTSCPRSQQVARVVERDGLTPAQAEARIDAQLPTDAKVQRGDFVIDTGGTFGDTNRQVDRAVEKLLELAAAAGR